MTTVPQKRIAGDQWPFGFQFVNLDGTPRPIAASEVVKVQLYVLTVDATYDLDVTITDAVHGIGIAVAPVSVTEGIAPLLPDEWAAQGYPVRLRGAIGDAAGDNEQTYFVEPVTALDWRTASFDALPPYPAIVAFAGPAGATGASAYQVAVAAGFTGTPAQWLASLEAPAPTQAALSAAAASALATLIAGLPTTLPQTSGVLWNDGGALSIS